MLNSSHNDHHSSISQGCNLSSRIGTQDVLLLVKQDVTEYLYFFSALPRKLYSSILQYMLVYSTA